MARLTPPRFLAYCLWPGMQPRQFLVGARAAADAPVPTVRGFLLNVAAGAALLWLVPRLLPAATPRAVRLWVALVGFCFLFLVARLDFWALIFRAMGFAVEKLWDCPVAATSLGEFWGRRWNRIVSGFLREVVFTPVARRAGARVALLAVFLYSGLYHEVVSFLAGSGYGGPTTLLPGAVPRGGGREQPPRPPRAPGPPLAGPGVDAGRGGRAGRPAAAPRVRRGISCRCWWRPACRGWDDSRRPDRLRIRAEPVRPSALTRAPISGAGNGRSIHWLNDGRKMRGWRRGQGPAHAAVAWPSSRPTRGASPRPSGRRTTAGFPICPVDARTGRCSEDCCSC